MKRLDALRDLVVKHIDDAQNRQARVYNKGRRHVEFHVGDIVLRRIKVLSNAAEGISGKLAEKWDGPFKIVEKMSPTVYRLEGVNAKGYDMVDVSRLKRFIAPRREL